MGTRKRSAGPGGGRRGDDHAQRAATGAGLTSKRTSEFASEVGQDSDGGPNDHGVVAEVTAAVGGLVAAHGLIVDAVQITPMGGSRVLKIVLDRDTEQLPADDRTSVIDPLSLDEVAEATRGISDALDDVPGLGEAPYTLEVTSPGVDRPLTRARHFRRNVGRLVVLTLSTGERLEGRLLAAGPDELTLKLPPKKGRPVDSGAERVVALADVTRGRVEVEFNRPDAEDDEFADEDLDVGLGGEITDEDLEADEFTDLDDFVDGSSAATGDVVDDLTVDDALDTVTDMDLEDRPAAPGPSKNHVRAHRATPEEER